MQLEIVLHSRQQAWAAIQAQRTTGKYQAGDGRRNHVAVGGRQGQRCGNVGQAGSPAVPWGLYRVKYSHVRG